jgi:hypothetical protein
VVLKSNPSNSKSEVENDIYGNIFDALLEEDLEESRF